MSKLKVRISEIKYRSFYKTLVTILLENLLPTMRLPSYLKYLYKRIFLSKSKRVMHNLQAQQKNKFRGGRSNYFICSSTYNQLA